MYAYHTANSKLVSVEFRHLSVVVLHIPYTHTWLVPTLKHTKTIILIHDDHRTNTISFLYIIMLLVLMIIIMLMIIISIVLIIVWYQW